MKGSLIVMALGALCLAPVAKCDAQVRAQAVAPTGPAVAYAVDGVLYLATESGEVVKKIDVEYPIGDFAISPDLKTVVFAPPHAGEEGGPLFILDIPSEKIEPVMPDPYFNDDSVAGDFALFYSDPEFSPDGKQVVFATHAYGDGNEVQLSGPLALLDIETREVSIVGSTVESDGLPLGYIRYPHWSPDGKQILGNVEGHSFVTGAAGEDLTELILPAGEVIQSVDSYGMLAVGWLGSGCVLYKAGEDLGHDPARIFTISSEETSPASELLRLPEESLRGVREFSGGLRLFVDEVGFRVEGPGISWLIQGDSEISYAHLLPQRGSAGQIPSSCNPPPAANVSADSLNIVSDALTKAADNLLKAANQSDYVQKAIAEIDQALDEAKQAAAHVRDDSGAAVPITSPNFDASPPPAPRANFMLYASLNSLKFAYDALTRVPGGDFGGYRTRMNDDIAAAAEVLVNGIASYNAKHPQ